MEKLRIAMLGHKRIPSREGGIERVVEELSTRLVELGHVVDVYNRKGHHVSGKKFDNMVVHSINEYNGVHIFTIPTFKNAKLNAIVYSFLATCKALFHKYDCIHFHAEGPCSMIWLPHLFGIRTIATIHGLDWQRAKWNNFATNFLKFGERMAVKYADEIIVLSDNMKKYFLDTYGRETKYIPNGINQPVIRESNIIKEKYGLKKNSYILFLGRIVPEKGLHYLIEAYKKIDTSKKLVIAGGSSHTDEYMKHIKQKAQGDEQILFTGFVQGSELEELYSNAYVYVLPSDIEGMPISLLEAMSYGNCCLVSDIAENIEVIENRGVSFQKGNIKELYKKLTWLLKDNLIVENYKNDASTFICKKYDWNMVVRDTIVLYETHYNKLYANE